MGSMVRGRRARAVAAAVLVALASTVVVSTPAAIGAAPPPSAITQAETQLPSLPLPDCKANGLAPTSDTVDCEGSVFDFSSVPAPVRPTLSQVKLAMNTRTLDFRKDADRTTAQTVTFTWTAPDATASSGGIDYAGTFTFAWPDFIDPGNWNDHYLKQRQVAGSWSSNVEGKPYGSSSNPPAALFVRQGTCGTASGGEVSTSRSCTYQVTWGDYGTRVQQALIYKVGLTASYGWTEFSSSSHQPLCGTDGHCAVSEGSAFWTFRTDPPPPVTAVADSRRTGPGQFTFDASRSGPDVVSYKWTAVTPTFSTTAPSFDFNIDDYDVGEFFTGGYMDLQVKDRWNRVVFATAPFSILQQVGTQGPLKIKSQTVKSTSGNTVTLEVVVENTTDDDIVRVGLISKRTPGGVALPTSPADATVKAKSTATFTITVDKGSLLDLDVTSEGFGLSSTSTNLRTGTAITHIGSTTPVAPTCTPGSPVATAATGTSVTVTTPHGSCPGTGAAAASIYRLLAYAGSSATAAQSIDVASTATSQPVSGLTAGTRYRFRLVAVNSAGTGPGGPLSAWALPPFTTIDRFTDRQYQDFAGRAATTAEKADWASRIGAGTLTPAAAANGAVDLPYWAKQAPVIRLFQAYFGRLPDLGGLDHWADKSRGGTSINVISSNFAASNEFRAKYGKLSNRAFVELVYQNVLGRPGDAGGIASWTAKLDKKTKTRGQVMVGFSESNEYKRKSQAVVDLVDVVTGMLRRVPTKDEAASWAASVANDGATRLQLVGQLLGVPDYVARAS